MSNLHRLQWIDSQIREAKYPNCSTIAEKFEITRRQASRDIEYLRYSLGAPVEYDHERRGYVYGEQFDIPKEKLNATDISLLAELSRGYEQINTSQGRKIADLFSRLYRGTVSVDPLPHQGDSVAGVRALIESCIRSKQDILITYIDAGNSRTVRIVTPLRIIQWGENELLEAWCHLRDDERQFRLDRIARTEIAGDTNPSDRAHPSTKTRSNTPAGCDVIQTDNDPKHSMREPFIAEIRTGLYRKSTDFYSFFETTKLLAWLVEHHQIFEIEKPQWLRRKAQEHFSQLANVHHQ